ncbi:MFS transporter [Thermomonospora umbrina]|uniref:EmrB/QacA subfamily drug resistance transporter n=1 Tax=Thermomonospora umbrina TaxID=111806 RepID=A0A3D9SGC1_9ACTN|nr:MFS transporter [Thermomonospora umbrina]REE94952.1 EmrB/QacA subfamily drug resistance transporter [Thermomonospora umbrina]
MSTSATTQPVPGAATPDRRARHPALALAIILACQVMVIMDATVVTVALPEIRRSLDFSATGLSWTQNAYTLAFGGLLLLGGRAGDILGRRRTLISGVLLFTLASLVGGFATSAGWLLAARAAQGVGAAIAAPSVLALIVTNFQGGERARALSLFSAVSGGGASLGLVGGGMLTEWASWRWVMFVNVPIGLAIVLLAPRYVREPQRRRGRFDVTGTVTSTAGMVALVYGFIRTAESGWDDRVAWAALAAALALLGAFVAVERRAAQPLTPLWLFAHRDRGASYAIMLLFASGMFGMFYFLTLYLQQVQGMSPLEAGVGFLPLTVPLFVVARLAPRLLARFGARRLIVGGLALLVAGLGWLTLLEADGGYGIGIVGPLLLFGLGAGLAVMPINTTILAEVPPEDSGAASGALQSMQQTGGSLGLAVLVTVFGAATPGGSTATSGDALAEGMSTAFGAAAAFLAIALVIAVTVLRIRPAAPAER